MTRTTEPSGKATESGLRPDCLSFIDVFAQSIATIAPTVGPALTIALVHESSGAGTWLTYLVATVAMKTQQVADMMAAQETSDDPPCV